MHPTRRPLRFAFVLSRLASGLGDWTLPDRGPGLPDALLHPGLAAIALAAAWLRGLARGIAATVEWRRGSRGGAAAGHR